MTPSPDWAELERFLHLIGRSRGPMVLATYPSDPSRPCIHVPADAVAIPRQEVEQLLQRHPGHSLGAVLNLPAPTPADWGTLPEHLNRRGLRRAWGASNDHIHTAIGCWLEADGGLPLDAQLALPELAGLLPPSLVVWSGGKSAHTYWLTRPAWRPTPGEFRNLQQRLVRAVQAVAPEAGADASICNPSRVMRLPGGIHPRTGERCRILSAPGHQYLLDDLLAMLPPESLPPDPAPRPTAPGLSLPFAATGPGWFSRLPTDRQQQLAVEMLRYLPLRTKEKQGLYHPSFQALAGLVHHFGADQAAAICSQAGWEVKRLWEPARKVHGIHASSNAAGIGSVIRLARDSGWPGPSHAISRRSGRSGRSGAAGRFHR
jgi:hypothetical protein